MDYDVIIAGGSFAGLAVAAQLRGRRVLLVEPHSIGAVQTSACGTLLAVLEATRTLDSLLQVHHVFTLHLGIRTVDYALPYPFCTFDYHTFCHRLLIQSDAELVQASVLGRRGHTVYTTRGVFEGEILVDATGWRAALATGLQSQKQAHIGKSFGLETVIPLQERGIHFYYDPESLGRNNVGWLFPTGATSRSGIASYEGHTQFNRLLIEFIGQRFGQSPNGRHGGYFPYQTRPAATGTVFRVGDSAGHCLPFSGEGIRPALYFGAEVGRLARRTLDSDLRLPEALRAYEKFVARHRAAYRMLWAAQKAIPGLPMAWVQALAGLLQPEKRISAIMWAYWKLFDPTLLRVPFGIDGVQANRHPTGQQPVPAEALEGDL